MRISTRGRFAVTAMIDVAIRDEFGPVPLAQVASRQNISLSYLEHLFSKLRRHGLVTSFHGPGGGYTLGRRSDGITVTDIIHAVDDVTRTEAKPVPVPVLEKTQDLWEAMDAKVLDFTHSVTLNNLVLAQLNRGVTLEQTRLQNCGVFQKPPMQSVNANVPNSVFSLGQTFRAP